MTRSYPAVPSGEAPAAAARSVTVSEPVENG